ncbi:hypothetical protein [Flavihumibacter profundi]|uniref:hypothetical protein n=1 Tax=Flavihumibacter profundi TaxID=2716883 RepID=UPI001CC5BE25|nr:hypothetical protein [Flavihumibacter profundi]MBZ5858549.1 hypothetical protein [Flavihumibacter profundi]
MNSKEFVNVIKVVVGDNTINGMRSNLEKPPGRKPSEKLLTMSKWYNELSEDDKKMVFQIVKESIDLSIFGFLCVLDGVTAIENENKGELKLFYQRGDINILLNDTGEEYLHDLIDK